MASVNPIDFFRSIQEWVTRRLVWHSHHVYRVTEQIGDRLSLKSVGSVAGLDDQLVLDKSHGLSGARELCATGQLVLVGFRNGNPALPYVASYLPALPLESEIDAQNTIRIGPSIGGLNIHAGGGNRPVAMGDTVEAWIEPAHEMLRLLSQYTNVASWAPADQADWAIAIAMEQAMYTAGTLTGWKSTRLATR